ncbi:two-component response regulator [Paucilactobacillus hokkaidonensis JCM 18461]|uniref:Two-component response regulator n=2 Tax=Paucilactobacillus hokkaidonensis TaxID=1193095 RepID=A0A0A1GW55_9LACO|nr:response regulator transcription factor [Paucilactobacillus hokkaidonensis]KRO10199.1 response regulator [Paucilactobacillus hokkaidonensis]BAP86215.1 two-component response regulator [Paucilactobacillus hokkaidonensis JCM 18461]
MKKVLVVDDEPAISTLLTYNLQQHGFETLAAPDGETALELVQNNLIDCILLDLMLPGMDGLTVLKRLLQIKSSVPVIIITAKSQEVDRIIGLELGADDYISKPFSPREVVARVNAVLRRNSKPQTVGQNVLKIDSLTLDLDRHLVQIHDHEINLTPKEFELLVYFVENRTHVLSRQQLLQHVWQVDYELDSRMVDIQVSHLRDKLREYAPEQKWIKTVRGFGYQFGLESK